MTDHDKFYLTSMLLFFILGWITCVWYANRHDRKQEIDPVEKASDTVRKYDLSNGMTP